MASSQEEWLLREQREALERQRREARPDIRLELPEAETEPFGPPPEEALCFVIDDVQLDGELAGSFDWIAAIGRSYVGHCVGQHGLAMLLREINRRLLAQGYATSRVVLPEQDLRSGTLKLHFVPGRLSHILLPQDYRGAWRTAFPLRPGDVLNIRGLEQGLEQMKRLASQDLQMQILPAEQPGYSDIHIEIATVRPWHLSLTADDSGSNATGKYQLAAQLGVDNPLALQDQLILNLNQDPRNEREKGARSHGIYYGLPFGYWLLELSHNRFKYHQTVDGAVQSFRSSGEGHDTQLDASRTFWRSNVGKSEWFAGLTVRRRHSYIDDTEIEVQRRRLSHVALGIRHRHYLNGGTLNLSLSVRQGVDLFGAEERLDSPDAPSPRYRIWQGSAGFHMPLQFVGQSLWLSSHWRGQWSDTRLYSLDWFSVGGRYSVRGFEDDNTLGGQRGWLARNELGMRLGGGRHSVFLILDAGGVAGQGTEGLDRHWLAGAGLGIRGQWWRIGYEAFLAHPLHAPKHFKNDDVTGGFALTWQL